jgi:VWFA-related protein
MTRLGVLGMIALATAGPLRAQAPRIPRAESDIEVTLVLLDTVVTDRKGRPVRDLAPGEFELLVDNRIVPIEAVENRCGRAAAGAVTAETPTGTGTSGNGTTVEAPASGGGAPAERNYILFFDMSHLKAASRSKAIKIATEFVTERMSPADRAMILAFARGLYVVSGFTSDRDLLAARLKRMEEDHKLIDTAPFEQEVTLQRLGHEASRSYRDAGNIPGATRLPSSLANPECRAEARMAEIETTRAVRALANTMPAFSGLRGRKALMLFTETLQADPGNAYYLACGIPFGDRPSLGLTLAPEIRDLARKANLAGVSFYPMDAGGMASGPTGVVMEQSLAFQKSIALSTGGESFIVMNDPLVAFDEAARDLSCYYMLAYRVEEGMKPGRHTVTVRVSRRKVRVRSRQSFALQTSEEASEQEMLAVLSNPGLYKDLPVHARGYTLADAGKGRHHFLLQASVPRDELVFLPAGPSERVGRVHLRGGVISGGKLACEFSDTRDLHARGDSAGKEEAVGAQALCDLDEGDYELVIAGRDEKGGALGTFWGRFSVGAGGSPSGALLWAPSPGGDWARLSKASWLPSDGTGRPLFVRHSLDLDRQEPGVLTFTACRTSGRSSTAVAALGSATLALRGRSTFRLRAAPAEETIDGRCALLEAEIRPGSLPPGEYAVVPSVAEPWSPTGGPVRLTIR